KVSVFLSGTIGSDCFNSLEFVNVRAPKVHEPAHMAAFAPGQTATMSWDVDHSLNIPSASVVASFDGGETWSVVANSVANDGSYSWKVPNAPTRDARLALVVLSGDVDETGPVRVAEVVETENFTILAATGVE